MGDIVNSVGNLKLTDGQNTKRDSMGTGIRRGRRHTRTPNTKSHGRMSLYEIFEARQRPPQHTKTDSDLPLPQVNENDTRKTIKNGMDLLENTNTPTCGPTEILLDGRGVVREIYLLRGLLQPNFNTVKALLTAKSNGVWVQVLINEPSLYGAAYVPPFSRVHQLATTAAGYLADLPFSDPTAPDIPRVKISLALMLEPPQRIESLDGKVQAVKGTKQKSEGWACERIALAPAVPEKLYLRYLAVSRDNQKTEWVKVQWATSREEIAEIMMREIRRGFAIVFSGCMTEEHYDLLQVARSRPERHDIVQIMPFSSFESLFTFAVRTERTNARSRAVFCSGEDSDPFRIGIFC